MVDGENQATFSSPETGGRLTNASEDLRIVRWYKESQAKWAYSFMDYNGALVFHGLLLMRLCDLGITGPVIDLDLVSISSYHTVLPHVSAHPGL